MAKFEGPYSGQKVGGRKIGQTPNFTPEQMDLFQQMFSHVGPDSYLSKLAGGDEEMFKQIEAPAWRQLQEAQGGMASRFSGSGMGARGGSGFQNAGNQQSQDFAMGLQSQRQQLQQQAIKDLMGMSDSLMNQKPYNTFLREEEQKSSGWGGFAGAALGGIGGFFAGGPMGALTGASMGYGLGSGKGTGGQKFQSSPNWDYNQYMPLMGNV